MFLVLAKIVTTFLSLIANPLSFEPAVKVIESPAALEQKFTESEQAPNPISQKCNKDTSFLRTKSIWQTRPLIRERHLESSAVAISRLEAYKKDSLRSPRIPKSIEISDARFTPLLC
jgi:hypothetical protein